MFLFFRESCIGERSVVGGKCGGIEGWVLYSRFVSVKWESGVEGV